MSQMRQRRQPDGTLGNSPMQPEPEGDMYLGDALPQQTVNVISNRIGIYGWRKVRRRAGEGNKGKGAQ